MKKGIITACLLALLILVLLLQPWRAPAQSANRLWPKMLEIIEKLGEIQQQNQTIVRNQESILQQMQTLQESVQSLESADKKK